MKLYLASYAMVTMTKILEHEGRDFVEAVKIALEKHGFDVIEVDVKNKDEEEIRKVIDGADVVLVAGGDTFYLMEKLKESGADKVIKEFIEKGGIYIGSSAGSIICCPTIEGAEEFDDPRLAPELDNFDGMGVFKDVIIPHTHKEKYFERVKKASKKLESKGYKVHPLTDDYLDDIRLWSKALTDDDVLFFDGSSCAIL